MNRSEMPPGFGLLARKGTYQAAILISQSPGAFPSGACKEKRQMTSAVQDAVGPCHRSTRVHGSNACRKRKRALHEPPKAVGQIRVADATSNCPDCSICRRLRIVAKMAESSSPRPSPPSDGREGVPGPG